VSTVLLIMLFERETGVKNVDTSGCLQGVYKINMVSTFVAVSDESLTVCN